MKSKTQSMSRSPTKLITFMMLLQIDHIYDQSFTQVLINDCEVPQLMSMHL